MASKFIKVGNPTGKSDLVLSIVKGLGTTSGVEKSSIHGADVAFCSRKSMLHLAVIAPEKVELDPTITLYFAVGNAIHDAMQKALRKSGILIANEMKIEYGPIRGYIDDIIVSAETGELKIIDVKTCGQLPAKIKPGQAEQLLCYALLTGIDEASIVYVSRSVANFAGLMIKEIQAPVNSTSMFDIAWVIAESLTYYDHRIIPPKPDYRPTRDGCGWCPFKDNGCWSEADGIRPIVSSFKYSKKLFEHKLEISILAKKLIASKSEFYKLTVENNPALKKWSESK